MAEIIPFPRVRNRRFVRKQAAFVGSYRRDVAEKHLAQQLKVQRETMTKRGIAPDRVEAEMRALELAIRFNAGMIVSQGGGDAA